MKYAGILRILRVICNITIAMTENIATKMPKGTYFEDN
jgi:hypothetical protein